VREGTPHPDNPVDAASSRQVAVVTGGSRGVGRGIAEVLASQGAAVCIMARPASEVEAVVCVSPGPVRTAITERLAESAEGRRWLPDFAEIGESEWLSPEQCGELVGSDRHRGARRALGPLSLRRP
jgi:hypothetical protein